VGRSLQRYEFTPPPYERYPKPIQIGRIGKGGQGYRIYSPRGHAITFAAQTGGAAGKTGAYLIDGRVRRLSPAECLRVMGFPVDYRIPLSDAQAYQLIGNSVAIPVVWAIFEEIVAQVFNRYRWIWRLESRQEPLPPCC